MVCTLLQLNVYIYTYTYMSFKWRWLRVARKKMLLVFPLRATFNRWVYVAVACNWHAIVKKKKNAICLRKLVRARGKCVSASATIYTFIETTGKIRVCILILYEIPFSKFNDLVRHISSISIARQFLIRDGSDARTLSPFIFFFLIQGSRSLLMT